MLTLEPTASRLEVWRATIAPAELCAHFGPILTPAKYIMHKNKKKNQGLTLRTHGRL